MKNYAWDMCVCHWRFCPPTPSASGKQQLSNKVSQIKYCMNNDSALNKSQENSAGIRKMQIHSTGHRKEILVLKNVHLLIFHVYISHLRCLTLSDTALFEGVSLQISQYDARGGE